jgi:hypothetical protein
MQENLYATIKSKNLLKSFRLYEQYHGRAAKNPEIAGSVKRLV